MTPTLAGVPLDLYGIPCLLLAFVFIFIWPHKLTPTHGWRRIVLRWGHSLVWFLLGLAAFAGGSAGFGGTPVAGILAMIAAGMYVLFVFTLVTTKRPT
jgi:hypothetical protein